MLHSKNLGYSALIPITIIHDFGLDQHHIFQRKYKVISSYTRTCDCFTPSRVHQRTQIDDTCVKGGDIY